MSEPRQSGGNRCSSRSGEAANNQHDVYGNINSPVQLLSQIEFIKRRDRVHNCHAPYDCDQKADDYRGQSHRAAVRLPTDIPRNLMQATCPGTGTRLAPTLRSIPIANTRIFLDFVATRSKPEPGLVLVVRVAAQLNVLDGRAATLRVRMHVMKLEPAGLGAAAAGADECTSS